MPGFGALIAFGISSVAFAGVASAQHVATARTDAWLDAGAARITQPSRERSDAATVGVGIGRSGPLLSLAGQAAFTLAGDSVGAGQATIVASLATPRFSQARTDLALSATRYGDPSSNGGNNGSAQFHQHVAWRFGGVSAAVAQSGTSRAVSAADERDLNAHFRAMSTGIAVWGAYRWARLSVGQQRILSDDYRLAEASGFALTRRASSYDYRDLLYAASIGLSRFELQATYAARTGGSATRGEARAFSASAALGITRSLAIVVMQGKQLADPLRGTPQAITAGAALRWRIGGRSSSAASAMISMERSEGNSVVTVRARAAADAKLEIATSYDDWRPTPMAREGSVFVARVTLPSGTHRVAVRVNGGEWSAPAGLARVSDDLGGTAGIIVVP